ncbi:hypothetical protein IWQ62_000133 [Dispira parvispora]|uniref:Uncharacterized protein n=1 Tax=Dispira parvispora TaxID=1520584 RepID=A0A9W8AVG7_9FUNG|nr:hypothetical protein IWQ62_000133 [Dispira parvispora]
MDPPSGGLPGGPAEASSSNSGLPTNRHLPRLQIPDVNFQFQSYLKDTPKTWIQERRNHRNGLVLQKLVYNITLKVLHRQTGELLRQFTYDITALWTPTALTWESFILAMDNAILSIASE